MSANKRVALVTGANRGIGLEICRQLAEQENIQVILGSRDADKGSVAAQGLAELGLKVDAQVLDVGSSESIAVLSEYITKNYGQLDILVNNAGVFIGRDGDGVLSSEVASIRQTMDVNVYGPLLLSQALAGLLQKSESGRIVNLSSGMGQLDDMGGGYTAYRLSKTALNALTRILAAELPKLMVNAMCPGWVKTDMGGVNATRAVRDGADTAVWLATVSQEKHLSGQFFRDRQSIPW